VSGNTAAPSEIEIDTDLATVSASDDTLASAKAIKTEIDTARQNNFNHVQNTSLAADYVMPTSDYYNDLLFVNTATNPGGYQVSIDHPENYANNARITIMNVSEYDLEIGKVGSPSTAFDFNCVQLFSSLQTSITLVAHQKALLIKTSSGNWDVIVTEV